HASQPPRPSRAHRNPHAGRELSRRSHFVERRFELLQRVVDGIVVHVYISCSFFRASKDRDFTVPSGTSSKAATARVSWPSIAESTITSRSFSGSRSIA